MRIALAAPFRTTLNLDTYVAFSHPEALWELTRAACRTMAAHDGFAARPGRLPRPGEGFLRYRAVAEDREHWYSSPVATVDLTPTQLGDTLARFAAGGALAGSARFVSASVALYDNTMAMLTLEIDAPASALGALDDASMLERALTDLAHDTVTVVSEQIAERFARIMAVNARRRELWPHPEPIVKAPEDFVAFDDIDADVIESSPLRATMLWAHRIYVADAASGEGAAWFARAYPDAAPHGEPFTLGWGNTFLFCPELLPTYLALMRQTQFFYVMFELLAASQLRLLRSVSVREPMRAAARLERKVERLEHLSAELESEYLLFVESLQGPRRAHVAAIMAGFNFEELKAACRIRLDFVERQLRQAERRRAEVYRRLVSFVFIVVGGTQVFQTAQDALAFARDVGDVDPAPGVTDLMRALPVDLTLNVVALCIVAVAAFWAMGRAR
ncbi:hypothetical protein [Rubrimonas cliftonensis]|uniref:CorA-like Mg2+ transporter protein n=1 Tax=Rubrimonas cliftonensis TaxID=89524 RepID=A0A1H4E2U6_9RHOB|nr:hypothetical protein [Rubrimonas cliftonensis]SEA79374.1 hypothetical protein SAMN05444370_11218 [Rubrimonas cliftonensis]